MKTIQYFKKCFLQMQITCLIALNDIFNPSKEDELIALNAAQVITPKIQS